jgi:FkbM family methyltransferase
MRPIPIGGDWALVHLHSGEYICVDLSSLDSLPHVLGWEYEADVIRVFRTFLTQRSVVLDIGANFGLYTALAASIVKNSGRLYAFEGNPQVFESLQRTIIANHLFSNPNITIVNLLVSDRCGRGVLYYAPNQLGGGTMSDVKLRGLDQPSVEVEMTTIDDYLPSNLSVDLVKIDVEGHEPVVIRGMERTIARSPRMRMIIEFADTLLSHSLKPADFLDYIRGLGFGICRLLPGFKMKLIPPGESLDGFNYCLLTRTPEEDIQTVYQRRKLLPIRFKRWLRRHPIRWGRYRRIWARW